MCPHLMTSDVELSGLCASSVKDGNQENMRSRGQRGRCGVVPLPLLSELLSYHLTSLLGETIADVCSETTLYNFSHVKMFQCLFWCLFL